MGDGFFTYDFGDTGPPTTWWYDEYDFNLGFPTGPATQIGSGQSTNFIGNGGFEDGLAGWQMNVVNDGQGRATMALDSTIRGSRRFLFGDN